MASFAGIGYVTLAATPLLAARPLWEHGHRVLGGLGVVAGAVSGDRAASSRRRACRPGLFQRLGLTAGDIWIATSGARHRWPDESEWYHLGSRGMSEARRADRVTGHRHFLPLRGSRLSCTHVGPSCEPPAVPRSVGCSSDVVPTAPSPRRPIRRHSTTGSSTAPVRRQHRPRRQPSPSTSAPSPSSSPSTAVVAAPWSSAEFDELDEFLAVTNSEAFAIVEGGVTVHEWYRTDDTYARDIASAQKSVLSLLVGRAIGDGIIGIDTLVDDVLGIGLDAARPDIGITVRHLLTMTSGLDDSLAVVSPPGTGWLYSGAFAQLFAVLEVTTGRDVDDLANEWLFDMARADTAVFYERRTDEARPDRDASHRQGPRRDRAGRARCVAARPPGWLARRVVRAQPAVQPLVRVPLVAERSGLVHAAGPGTSVRGRDR